MKKLIKLIKNESKRLGYLLSESIISDMKNTITLIEKNPPLKITKKGEYPKILSWFTEKYHIFIRLNENGIVSYINNDGKYDAKQLDRI